MTGAAQPGPGVVVACAQRGCPRRLRTSHTPTDEWRCPEHDTDPGREPYAKPGARRPR